MCGCNKGKSGLSNSCKRYVSRLTAAKVRLLVEIQNTNDPVKISMYQEIVDEIVRSMDQNTCPKLAVVTTVEKFIIDEFN